MNISAITIVALLFITCTSAVNLSMARKRSFTKVDKKTSDLTGTKFEKYKKVIEEVKVGDKKIEAVQFNNIPDNMKVENAIIIDAGGSGTRLYIFEKESPKISIAVKYPMLATTKDTSTLAKFIADCRDLNKGKTIGLATAGMRLAIGDKSKNEGDMQTMVCGKEDQSKCIGRVMPGAMEGVLGLFDGSYSVGKKYKVDEKGCYIEYGSTSSQFAFKAGDKYWALSGVRSGLGPTDQSLQKIEKCDSIKNKANVNFMKDCNEAVGASVIFDKELKDCLSTGKAIASKFKCDKLMIRWNKAVEARIKAGMQNKDGCMFKEGEAKFFENFNCGAALGMRRIVEGLGLGDLLKDDTMISLAGDEEVEWAWGLFKKLSENGYDISKFKGKDQSGVSDCHYAEF